MKRYIYPVVLLIIMATPLLAQEEPEAISADRPDQSEGPGILTPGYYQIETGFLYDFAGSTNAKSYNIGTTLLRFGLTDFSELRAASEYTILEAGTDESIKGVNGLTLGVKVPIINNNSFPETAIVADFTLPVGNKDFTGDDVVPTFLIAMAKNLTDNVGLSWNIGGTYEAEEITYLYSLGLGFGISEKTSAFVEAYGDLPENATGRLFFDTGIVYLLVNNMQIDIAGGRILSEKSAEWFITAGFSIRLPE